MRSTTNEEPFTIPEQVLRDITWWKLFLHNFNGVSMISSTKMPKTWIAQISMQNDRILVTKDQNTWSPTVHSDPVVAQLSACMLFVESNKDQLIPGEILWFRSEDKRVVELVNTGRSFDKTELTIMCNIH